MNSTEITTELADCKSTNRYVVDANGDRFWVFGMPTGELLVRRIVEGIMKPLRTMQYDEVVSIEPKQAPDITTEEPVSTVTFTATIDPPREVQAGFVNHIEIQFSDYGKPVRENDEQFNVCVRIRGTAKLPSGKPDRRTRSNGLLTCYDWSELTLAMEVMRKFDHPMAAQTIQAIEERHERVCP